MKRQFFGLIMLLLSTAAMAEDGHQLWLRMAQAQQPVKVTVSGKGAKSNAVVKTATAELSRYWTGSKAVTLAVDNSRKDDGYDISTNGDRITISGNNHAVLYGAYALLRDGSNATSSKPSYDLRILNHWDNPNGTVERGYAGHSIFWPAEGDAIQYGTKEYMQRLREYGRANASIGINATVLNNVNAKPAMLSKEKLAQTKAIADQLRPYGMRVFLSVNFASPKALGGLPTADPLDPQVQQWWKKKVDEIYRLIPDFGGFLVKANSEGEPGPMDYNRTHSDGANMLADALAGHGGIVMWRAFVYAPASPDRASQAYLEFVPLDGQFRKNVIIQIKNGPIDFQPREAVSPLFFGLKQTAMMPEFQITQEYTGHSNHTCFLAPMWQEFFDVEGGASQGAIAGVANIGDTRNWCGSDMAQANWYAFGRMAWDKNLTPKQIADEWLKQTFSEDSRFVASMSRVLCLSREAVVHYMMPMGLHHIFAGGHHYGPEPWYNPDGAREDWKPRYYHRADSIGLGFNRTTNGGTANTRQYPDRLFNIYNNVETCPEQLLLWFHHASWTHRMHNGETMWDALCHTYDLGVREAASFAEIWKQNAAYVDAERHEAMQKRFVKQARDAWWWRDACLLYFQQFSKLPLPIDCPTPRHDLKSMMQFNIPIDNYTAAPLD